MTHNQSAYVYSLILVLVDGCPIPLGCTPVWCDPHLAGWTHVETDIMFCNIFTYIEPDVHWCFILYTQCALENNAWNWPFPAMFVLPLLSPNDSTFSDSRNLYKSAIHPMQSPFSMVKSPSSYGFSMAPPCFQKFDLRHSTGHRRFQPGDVSAQPFCWLESWRIKGIYDIYIYIYIIDYDSIYTLSYSIYVYIMYTYTYDSIFVYIHYLHIYHRLW